MQICVQKVKEHAFDVFYNGGRFIQQFGLYQQCSQAKLQYSLSLFVNNATHNPSGLYIGLCLPTQCTHQIIQSGLDAFLMEAKLPFVTGKIINDPQNLSPQNSILFYPVLIFITLLILFTIWATAISRFPKYRDHPSLPLRLLSSFNFYETLKIFTYKKNVFNVFNGVKSICMFWVIFGHQFSTRLKNAVNILNIPSHIETWFYLFVIGAFFAVDVFFFIGGFLVAYSFLRQKSKSPLKYPFAIIHRVLRFWPSYITAILIFYSILMHTGYGPFWWQSYDYAQISDCKDFWKPIFFVDNLVDNGQKMCLPWGWYLQNDMQIFIFSMIYLFVYSKNKFLTKLLIIGTIGISLTINFIFAQSNEYIQVTHLADFAKWNQYFPNIYIKPWTRCPPYLIGLFFGLQYMQYLALKKQRQHSQSHHQKRNSINQDDQQNQKNTQLKPHIYFTIKDKLQNNKMLLYFFQIFGFGIMLFVLLIPRTLQLGNTWPQSVHSFYLSAGKVFFVLGLYIMILPSLLDIQNMTFFLMDTKFFNFISKISFWTYLIHYMIIVQIAYSQKVDFYYTVQDILPIYCPIAVLSLFFGLLGTIFVQVPFAKIQKMLMNKAMGKKQDRKIQKIGSITEPLTQSLKESIKKDSVISQDDKKINMSIKM